MDGHSGTRRVTRLRGEPVGVVRFIRDTEKPTSAEIAVEVVDEWQNRGVGSLPPPGLRHVYDARNLSQLTALTSVSSRRAAGLFAKPHIGETHVGGSIQVRLCRS